MIKKVNIIIVIFLTIFLYSCQGAKEAFQSKKRSDQSDEFLVKKKNPLTMPPDFDKLPIPGDIEFVQDEAESSSEIKDLLNINQNDNESNSDQPTSIEDSILRKIQ
tara:strand:- start:573 stop:890 length:318 start_codon:yes stop_codon:yes gene_type:complete